MPAPLADGERATPGRNRSVEVELACHEADEAQDDAPQESRRAASAAPRAAALMGGRHEDRCATGL
jgi:hypothetical protein